MSNILCGTATANGGTILTVPASTTWQGVITLSACVATGAGGAAVNASARVSVAGASSDPVNGDYLRLDLAAPASVLGAIGTNDSGSIASGLFTLTAPSGNAVTLVLNTNNTTGQSASAVGVTL